ncbi:conserved rodent malaria protein, unknown function [Plasmodium chabaudi chabaudi]|uniref:Uncharacterized protein n=1 Tax=Plasmodium chabaudi chabaudi TaxID=31271 RepID=A0A4V0K618_PLACU|nr:conserved rodent malaria protein, unknown function [Plasmodium chabaudi chabaudi]VTZ67583.1 conserved rodent malaria protein, unknown function [Plasmodium chabaudi chabaudi]|eukprot:XP_016655255.1 conserved rodent malaria protein, unknown function [Plasmodium chabaudi chabaudi]
MFPYFALIFIFLFYKNTSFVISSENEIKSGENILITNDNPVKELSTEEISSFPNEYNITIQYNQSNDNNASPSKEIQTELLDHDHDHKSKTTTTPISRVKKAFRKLFIIKPYINGLIKKKSNNESDDLDDDPEVTPYSKEIESEIDALKDKDEKDNLDNQKEIIDFFHNADDKDSAHSYNYDYKNDDDKSDAYSFNYDEKDDDDDEKDDDDDDDDDGDDDDDEDDDEYVYDEDDDDEYVYDYDDDEYVYEDGDDDDESSVIKKRKSNTPSPFGAERDPMLEPSSKPTKIRDKPSYIKDKKKGENPIGVVKKAEPMGLVEYDYNDEPDIMTKIRSINKIDVTLRDELYDETERLLFESVMNQETPKSKCDIVEKLLNRLERALIPATAVQAAIVITAIALSVVTTGC